jgi:hypothetical protein
MYTICLGSPTTCVGKLLYLRDLFAHLSVCLMHGSAKVDYALCVYILHRSTQQWPRLPVHFSHILREGRVHADRRVGLGRPE